jgi:hypothetical protein
MDAKPAIKISLQKSRCYNWEIVAGGSTVDEILEVLRDADTKLQREYGRHDGGA